MRQTIVEISDGCACRSWSRRSRRHAFERAPGRLFSSPGRLRLPGRSVCRSAAETRKFQAALARKRQRVAFPDDFTVLARELQERVAEKHDKKTPEGDALR